MAEYLIGHNITLWDIPNLERVLGIKVKAKLIDTLALSWYLYPERNRHGLEFWGQDYGVEKPKIDDWDNLSLEEYKHRCSEDVVINTKLWNDIWKYLLKLYDSEEEALRLIEYLSFKMDCAAEQEASGWLLDQDLCNKSFKEMEEKFKENFDKLFESMPKVDVYTKKTRPKEPFKKDGTYSVHGAKWFALLRKSGLDEDFDGTIDVLSGEKDPNPNSHSQVKDWLFSLGWKPISFDYKKDDDGNTRKIPQVRVEGKEGKQLCESVKRLILTNSAVKYLDGITILSHRMSLLKGFLENLDERGRVPASIQGLTNTLRFKHKVLVNLPGVNKPYGDVIRGCLIAPEGYELCGSDMSSLEDRTKQHYMWDYDPDYVTEMNVEGFDPHLDIAIQGKMLTQQQVDAHKDGTENHSRVRHGAKTANYACTYGAAAPAVSRQADIPMREAEKLVNVYWQRNWAIKEIANDCIVKTVNKQKWLFNPVSKLWYSLRHDKDRFSTLNQGTGAYCFDRWVWYIRSRRSQLTAQFHDEVALCIRTGNRKRAVRLLKWAIGCVNKELKLNRELDVDVDFGNRYSEIH